MIVYDDVYDTPGPPPLDQAEVIPPSPGETVVWKPRPLEVEGRGLGLGARPLRGEAGPAGGLGSRATGPTVWGVELGPGLLGVRPGPGRRGPRAVPSR